MSSSRINLVVPNPFTIRPISTTQVSNELLLRDFNMRTQARVMIEDIGLTNSSKFISPMHLELGWKWR
jgi:hypothetical protein